MKYHRRIVSEAICIYIEQKYITFKHKNVTFSRIFFRNTNLTNDWKHLNIDLTSMSQNN